MIIKENNTLTSEDKLDTIWSMVNKITNFEPDEYFDDVFASEGVDISKAESFNDILDIVDDNVLNAVYNTVTTDYINYLIKTDNGFGPDVLSVKNDIRWWLNRFDTNELFNNCADTNTKNDIKEITKYLSKAFEILKKL